MNALSSSGRHGLCARVFVLVLDRDGMGERRRRNVLRQEEITEEIEVLMLSSFTVPRRR